MNPNPTPVLLRKADVLRMLRISKSSLHAKLTEGGRYFDLSFPQPFRLPNGRSPYWRLEPLLAWIEQAANKSAVPRALSDRRSSHDSITSVPDQSRQRVARPDLAIGRHVTSGLDALQTDAGRNLSTGEQATVRAAQGLVAGISQTGHPPIVEETSLAVRRRHLEVESVAVRQMMATPCRSLPAMNISLYAEPFRQSQPSVHAAPVPGPAQSNHEG